MFVIKFIKYAFTAIGLGLLVGSYFAYQSTTGFLASAVTAGGVVVDLEARRGSDSTTYAPSVKFTTANGESITFTSSSSSNPPAYSRGERVEVLYLPGNAYEAKINGFFSVWGATVILAGIGAIFFLVGGGMLVYGVRSARRKQFLREHGARITTKLESVGQNTRVRVNGRHPYVIRSQWQDPVTSKVHIFESDNIWFDPANHIHGDDITVLIEPGRPKNYHVDISFLPRVAD